MPFAAAARPSSIHRCASACASSGSQRTRSNGRRACCPTTTGSSGAAQVVAQALEHAAANGLPGEHHFYLTFRTDHPGVVIPPRLRAQYPQEMTIVLQHQFWDLKMDTRRGLHQRGAVVRRRARDRWCVPLAAVTGFADPHVRYGLRFRPNDARRGGSRTPEPEAAEDARTSAELTPQVVSLEAFRRRPPSKE